MSACSAAAMSARSKRRWRASAARAGSDRSGPARVSPSFTASLSLFPCYQDFRLNSVMAQFLLHAVATSGRAIIAVLTIVKTRGGSMRRGGVVFGALLAASLLLGVAAHCAVSFDISDGWYE